MLVSHFVWAVHKWVHLDENRQIIKHLELIETNPWGPRFNQFNPIFLSLFRLKLLVHTLPFFSFLLFCCRPQYLSAQQKVITTCHPQRRQDLCSDWGNILASWIRALLPIMWVWRQAYHITKIFNNTHINTSAHTLQICISALSRKGIIREH